MQDVSGFQHGTYRSEQRKLCPKWLGALPDTPFVTLWVALNVHDSVDFATVETGTGHRTATSVLNLRLGLYGSCGQLLDFWTC